MVFLREKPPSGARFLSALVVGEPWRPRAQHPVSLWFSALAARGSISWGEKRVFFKGQNKQPLEKERGAGTFLVHRKQTWADEGI